MIQNDINKSSQQELLSMVEEKLVKSKYSDFKINIKTQKALNKIFSKLKSSFNGTGRKKKRFSKKHEVYLNSQIRIQVSNL